MSLDPNSGQQSSITGQTVGEADPKESSAARLASLFYGPSKGQLIAHILLFAAITFVLAPMVVTGITVHLLGSIHPTEPAHLLFLETGNFAILFGLSAGLARLEHRPMGDYGLPARDMFGRKFWLGVLFGLAEITLLIGVLAALGGYSFGNLALSGADALRWGLTHIVLFLFVGFYEEFLFRGYLQFALSELIGFWPTAILLSAGFGCIHLENRGENWVGALSVAIIGLLFAFTLRRTGSLWYAIGLHASFDWGESFLYSVPDSGEVLRGHLSNALLHGPTWLTGGSVGPEGSVFSFVTMGLQFLVVMWLFPKKAPQTAPEVPVA